MPVTTQTEHGIIVVLVGILVWMVWEHHHRVLRKLWEKVKAGGPRRWRPKSPHDCPAYQEGMRLAVQHVNPDTGVNREIRPWSQVKSSRGRKKRIDTRGYVCPDPSRAYFGITDPDRHALVGYGKRGKSHDIQTLRCQACGCAFSSHRNTPLYYIKTAHDRVEIVL
jgi:hypothetical protein